VIEIPKREFMERVRMIQEAVTNEQLNESSSTVTNAVERIFAM